MKLDRRAGEFRQHQHAGAVAAAGDVFLGDEVHAVLEGGHQHDVGGEEQMNEILEGQALVQIVQHRPAELCEVAVDRTDQLLDLGAGVGVAPHIVTAGRGDLDERDLGGVERAVAKQLLEGLEPGVDALGVVEAVDAEQQVLGRAERCSECVGCLPGGRVSDHLVDAVDVDRDRERPDGDAATLDGDLGDRIDRHDLLGAAHAMGEREKVAGVGRGLEADDVGGEQAVGDRFAPRQAHQQLRGREGRVEEEADADVGPGLTHERRHQLQVVVVDPERAVLFGGLDRGLGELLVDPSIGSPPGSTKAGRQQAVVIERPQGAVGEPFVVVGVVGLAERHRPQRHVAEAGRRRAVGSIAQAAVPADPDRIAALHHGGHRGDEPAGAQRPAAVAVEAHGEPVGGDDDVVSFAGRSEGVG